MYHLVIMTTNPARTMITSLRLECNTRVRKAAIYIGTYLTRAQPLSRRPRRQLASQTHGDSLLLHHHLGLLDNFVDPDLDLLLRFLLRRACLRIHLLPALPALLLPVLLALAPPRVPLIHEPSALRDELGADVAFFRSVLLLELSAVLLEIFADLALLLLCEQCARPWAP